MTSFSDISCLHFDISQLFYCFGAYESSAFGCILPLCPVNHHHEAMNIISSDVDINEYKLLGTKLKVPKYKLLGTKTVMNTSFLKIFKTIKSRR